MALTMSVSSFSLIQSVQATKQGILHSLYIFSLYLFTYYMVYFNYMYIVTIITFGYLLFLNQVHTASVGNILVYY